MTGEALREAFEHGVGMARSVQISGAALEGRRSRPRGKRLAAAAVGGAPLDDAKMYTVAALDFMTDGGDGYSAFDHFVSSEATGLLARDLLGECARKQARIVAPAAGRLIFRED